MKFLKMQEKFVEMHLLGCNILYAINDYGRVARDACEAGANINYYWCWNTYKYAINLQKNYPRLFTKDCISSYCIKCKSIKKLICKNGKIINFLML